MKADLGVHVRDEGKLQSPMWNFTWLLIL
jgi:hypothetical protein